MFHMSTFHYKGFFAAVFLAAGASAVLGQTAGSWETVFLETFEHAGGGAKIGPNFILPSTGDDVSKHAWNGAYSGTRVIKLRDDSGPESTLESRLVDVSPYSRIEFSFFYRGDSMNDGDHFGVEFQYNDDGPWYPAAEIVAGGSEGFPNGEWRNQCLQWILHAGAYVDVSGVKFRIVAFGDDDWDIVYIDDVQVRGMLKNDQPIEAPTPSPMNLVNNQCTENSGSWPNFFTATFNVGGGSLYIGEAFEKLVDGGNAQKLPGVGEDGSTTVRLRENTDTSLIVTKSIEISSYIRVECSFDFKFEGMEALEAGTSDPDNLLVEYQLDDGAWVVATDLIMDGNIYANGQWNSGCFQISVDTASTLKIRFLAGGDTGHTDFVYLDNVSLEGKIASSPTTAPSTDDDNNNNNNNNVCTDTTIDWPYINVADFDVGGGPLYIGGMFNALIDGGNVKKLPGAGFEGTTAVRLQDNTETSSIVSFPQDVSNFDRVEGTFMFQFLGMESHEAQSSDPDNLLVEYQVDGGSWIVAGDYIMDGVTYSNGPWFIGCVQFDIPEGASTLSFRFVAGGDTGHTDFIYLDDIALKGRSKDSIASYECSDDSSAWSLLFFEGFEYAGGADNIGSLFSFGGPAGDDDSVKAATGSPGTITHTGTRSIRLKDNSDASRIYTVPLDVSVASRVELTFWFKLRGMDDQDNFFVEYALDGSSTWTVASDIVKIGSNYLNEEWYRHCIQISLPDYTSSISIQVRADGQEGDTDVVFVDDFEMKYVDGSMS